MVVGEWVLGGDFNSIVNSKNGRVVPPLIGIQK